LRYNKTKQSKIQVVSQKALKICKLTISIVEVAVTALPYMGMSRDLTSGHVMPIYGDIWA
jgi:hypothetical protein